MCVLRGGEEQKGGRRPGAAVRSPVPPFVGLGYRFIIES